MLLSAIHSRSGTALAITLIRVASAPATASDPLLVYENNLKHAADAYADPEDQKHPYVSPVYGDHAQGFPPTLIQVGTTEIFLSNAIRHHQTLADAGVPVKIDPYEGMWHVFQAFTGIFPSPIVHERKWQRSYGRSLGREECNVRRPSRLTLSGVY